MSKTMSGLRSARQRRNSYTVISSRDGVTPRRGNTPAAAPADPMRIRRHCREQPARAALWRLALLHGARRAPVRSRSRGSGPSRLPSALSAAARSPDRAFQRAAAAAQRMGRAPRRAAGRAGRRLASGARRRSRAPGLRSRSRAARRPLQATRVRSVRRTAATPCRRVSGSGAATRCSVRAFAGVSQSPRRPGDAVSRDRVACR